jgi:hypothetical protein
MLDAMVTAIVLVVLGAGMVASFVLTLRLSRRTPDAAARRDRPSGPTSGLDRLQVGARLVHDGQRWDVIGVQHVRPADGDAWSAWHLDDHGQPGWMATSPGAGDLLFAVRAERPTTLDATLPRLTWRDHEWVRIEDGSAPAEAAGERRLSRGPRVPLRDAVLARTVFTREALRSRRLVLERAADEERPTAWIGDLLPAHVVDVLPPREEPAGTRDAAAAGGPAAPAADRPA